MVRSPVAELDPPVHFLRQFLLDTPQALDKVIYAYFTTAEAPHYGPDSELVGWLADWFQAYGEPDWALTMAIVAVNAACREAGDDEGGAPR